MYPWDPIPFDTFIVGLDDGAEHSLSKERLMTPNWEELLVHQSRALVQKELNKLEKCAARNLTKLNNGKCKALHLRGAVPVYSGHHLAGKQLGRQGPGSPGETKAEHDKED